VDSFDSFINSVNRSSAALSPDGARPGPRWHVQPARKLAKLALLALFLAPRSGHAGLFGVNSSSSSTVAASAITRRNGVAISTEHPVPDARVRLVRLNARQFCPSNLSGQSIAGTSASVRRKRHFAVHVGNSENLRSSGLNQASTVLPRSPGRCSSDN